MTNCLCEIETKQNKQTNKTKLKKMKLKKLTNKKTSTKIENKFSTVAAYGMVPGLL